jgi:hypothetical protein
MKPLPAPEAEKENADGEAVHRVAHVEISLNLQFGEPDIASIEMRQDVLDDLVVIRNTISGRTA